MHDYRGNFSLGEVAQILDIGAPFIRTVLKTLKIKVPNRSHKRGTYNMDLYFMEAIVRVKVLKKLGFKYDEIKKIWDLEAKIISLRDPAKKKKRLTEALEVPLLLHPESIYLPHKTRKGTKGQKYGDLVKKLTEKVAKVDMKRGNFIKDSKEVENMTRDLEIWFV